MIILDTNVLSEFMRQAPSPAVLRWSRSLGGAPVTTTAINEAEILLGLAVMPEGRRRDDLMRATDIMFATLFAGPILGFDRAAAAHFARIVALRRSIGRPIMGNDAMIAAIAVANGARAIATRDLGDYDGCGVALVNPWDA